MVRKEKEKWRGEDKKVNDLKDMSSLVLLGGGQGKGGKDGRGQKAGKQGECQLLFTF